MLFAMTAQHRQHAASWLSSSWNASFTAGSQEPHPGTPSSGRACQLACKGRLQDEAQLLSQLACQAGRESLTSSPHLHRTQGKSGTLLKVSILPACQLLQANHQGLTATCICTACAWHTQQVKYAAGSNGIRQADPAAGTLCLQRVAALLRGLRGYLGSLPQVLMPAGQKSRPASR